VRLPASITIAAGSTTYRVARDGRVRRVPAPPSPYPRASTWFPGTGTWFMLVRHYLVVGRGRQALWRSRLLVPSRWRLGVVTASAHDVAFQFEHKLYIAPIGGVERPVAHRELPLGWSGAALYTYAYRGRQLQLRSASGRLLKVIARRPLSDYFVADGRLYFILRGSLMRASGTRIERLASLHRLGLSSDSWMQTLGQFVQLQDDHRLVVIHDDGSGLVSTPLPPGRDQNAGLVGSPAVAPRAGAVAFATVSDRSAGRSDGAETVYVLRPGAQAAAPVHTETGSFGGCARWVTLQWHGKWLLYSSNQGNVALIDSTGRERAVELTRLVRRLPGAGENGFSAYWTGAPAM
jgi:hypothetical protein